MMQQKKILLLTYNKTPIIIFLIRWSGAWIQKKTKNKRVSRLPEILQWAYRLWLFLYFLFVPRLRAQSLLLRLIKESQCQRCKLSTNSPFLFTCVKMKKCTFAPHKNLLTRTSPHQSLSSTICHVYLLFLSRNKEKKSRSPNRWKISFSHSLGLAQFLTCPHLFRVYWAQTRKDMAKKKKKKKKK
jgi:hypothetical protein